MAPGHDQGRAAGSFPRPQRQPGTRDVWGCLQPLQSGLHPLCSPAPILRWLCRAPLHNWARASGLRERCKEKEREEGEKKPRERSLGARWVRDDKHWSWGVGCSASTPPCDRLSCTNRQMGQ